ncbi:hypothetical protein AZE42_04718 [Rhizopogon vesiculosus]|uniref:Uncharacterized protein n=1 Tax=Rhizopogon vesiculosus TaxID=180088 RepID=A0A1J8PJE0_9AGAM|nr:hypothetical protein AZE42_04718 [Rhizopogon vesiculosus]
MTLAMLISVSLLALVVMSLPVLPDSELFHKVARFYTNNFLFGIESCVDLRGDIQMDIVSASSATDNGYLSFDVELLNRMSELPHVERPGPSGQWMVTTISSGDEVPIVHNLTDIVTTDASLTSMSTLELIFSCNVVLLALACVGLGLFIIKHIRTRVLSSHRAWQILPRIEAVVLSSCKGHHSGTAWAVVQSVLNKKLAPLLYFCARTPTALSNISIITSSDLEDSEGMKFGTSGITPSLSVQEVLLLNSPSPGLLLSPITPTPDLTVDDQFRPPQVLIPLVLDSEIHELPTHSAGSMQVATPNPTSLSLPNIHSRSRQYHDFDIALAMKPRLGLRVGIDPVWMMHFVMAIFGWFAIALTGSR